MQEPKNSLQSLIDKEDIRDVLLRYARAVDRLDVELFRTVFWEDGGFEDGIVEGPARDFAPTLIDAVGHMFAATQHFISNIRVELDGPDVAVTESYFLAFHLVQGEESLKTILGARRVGELGVDPSRPCELYVGGRYFDRLVKRGASWRILKRRFVADWTSSGADSGLGREGFASLWKLWGSRNRSDPSYRR